MLPGVRFCSMTHADCARLGRTCSSMWFSHNDRDKLLCTPLGEFFFHVEGITKTSFHLCFIIFLFFFLLHKFYGVYVPDIMLLFLHYALYSLQGEVICLKNGVALKVTDSNFPVFAA
jgi:hypothetical protein